MSRLSLALAALLLIFLAAPAAAFNEAKWPETPQAPSDAFASETPWPAKTPSTAPTLHSEAWCTARPASCVVVEEGISSRAVDGSMAEELMCAFNDLYFRGGAVTTEARLYFFIKASGTFTIGEDEAAADYTAWWKHSSTVPTNCDDVPAESATRSDPPELYLIGDLEGMVLDPQSDTGVPLGTSASWHIGDKWEPVGALATTHAQNGGGNGTAFKLFTMDKRIMFNATTAENRPHFKALGVGGDFEVQLTGQSVGVFSASGNNPVVNQLHLEPGTRAEVYGTIGASNAHPASFIIGGDLDGSTLTLSGEFGTINSADGGCTSHCENLTIRGSGRSRNMGSGALNSLFRFEAANALVIDGGPWDSRGTTGTENRSVVSLVPEWDSGGENTIPSLTLADGADFDCYRDEKPCAVSYTGDNLTAAGGDTDDESLFTQVTVGDITVENYHPTPSLAYPTVNDNAGMVGGRVDGGVAGCSGGSCDGMPAVYLISPKAVYDLPAAVTVGRDEADVFQTTQVTGWTSFHERGRNTVLDHQAKVDPDRELFRVALDVPSITPANLPLCVHLGGNGLVTCGSSASQWAATMRTIITRVELTNGDVPDAATDCRVHLFRDGAMPYSLGGAGGSDGEVAGLRYDDTRFASSPNAMTLWPQTLLRTGSTVEILIGDGAGAGNCTEMQDVTLVVYGDELSYTRLWEETQ